MHLEISNPMNDGVAFIFSYNKRMNLSVVLLYYLCYKKQQKT